MFGNLQEQGDHSNSFDFFTGFQNDAAYLIISRPKFGESEEVNGAGHVHLEKIFSN